MHVQAVKEDESPALQDSMDDAMEAFDVNVLRTQEIVQRLKRTLVKISGVSSTATTATNFATSTPSFNFMDIMQRTSMTPNLNNKKHSALSQLRHKIIPVFAGTEMIDFVYQGALFS